MSDLQPLFDAARSFCLRRYGCLPKTIIITLTDGQRIELPVPPVGAGYPGSLSIIARIEPDDDPDHARNDPGDCSHTSNFKGIRWGGKRFTFSPMQAHVIAVLWEAWHTRVSKECEEQESLEVAGSDSSGLRDLFRRVTDR